MARTLQAADDGSLARWLASTDCFTFAPDVCAFHCLLFFFFYNVTSYEVTAKVVLVYCRVGTLANVFATSVEHFSCLQRGVPPDIVIGTV